MPSRPLDADRKATTGLHTHAAVLAQRVAHDRTLIPVALAALSTTVLPCRTDIVCEVLYRYGKPRSDMLDWPPFARVAELLYETKRLTLGEARLIGPNGEAVQHVAFRDTMGGDRRVLRLTVAGRHVADFNTVDQLGQHTDVTTLVEDRRPEDPEPSV